jgi:hypothetical protein
VHHACLLLARCHLCGFAKNQTCVVPWFTRVLFYDWLLVSANYPIHMPPFNWFMIHLLLKSTCYTSISSRAPFYLAYTSTIILAYMSPFYWFLCQLICPVIYFKFRINKNTYFLTPSFSNGHLLLNFVLHAKLYI